MICKESVLTTLTAENTWRQRSVPTDEAFKTPDSVTATVPVTEKVFVICAVSLVTEVVTSDTVPAALERPDVAVSLCKVVSVALAAVAPVPTAIKVAAAGEPEPLSRPEMRACPAFVIRFETFFERL